MVAIMIDGNGGLTVEEAKELGVFRINMPVIIDGESYFEEEGLSSEKFYSALNNESNVSTSQPAPGVILDMWDEILGSGYDEIVYIPMSSSLSGSYESSLAFADDYDGKVHVVNNRRVSVTLRVSVMDALILARQGKSGAQIKEILEEMGGESSIYIAVNTLDHLKKSGRATAAAAAIGSALSIKPILTIQGGKLDAFALDRNMKKCQKKILEALRNDIEKRFAHIPKEELIIGATTSCLNTSENEEWTRLVEETFEGIEVFFTPLSLSIGAHVGVNAIGVGICRRLVE